ncbi:MAG: 4-hydroxy-tetrahydrodipicolinate reductase [Spirochaetota bacterium]|nr:4-hydroxy-tetrahydrodipicolinate reductase [Spirochaetota bacterium]
MPKIGICGISGRMGRTTLRILIEGGHTLGAAFEIEGSSEIGRDAGCLIGQDRLNIQINAINERDVSEVDGIIDFSAPEASLRLLAIAKDLKKPIVICTTGFSDDERRQIEEASNEIPLIFSPNTSLGVNLLFRLTEMVSKVLKTSYDIEIFEAHHRFKKDAPSGTARRLFEIVKESDTELNGISEIYDRSSRVQQREDGEVGVMAMRGGDIVGEHTVYFIGMGERIELTHRMFNREAFARGAVLGIEYLVNKEPGSYNMFEVLGI